MKKFFAMENFIRTWIFFLRFKKCQSNHEKFFEGEKRETKAIKILLNLHTRIEMEIFIIVEVQPKVQQISIFMSGKISQFIFTVEKVQFFCRLKIDLWVGDK
jgi:hypothetical protein